MTETLSNNELALTFINREKVFVSITGSDRFNAVVVSDDTKEGFVSILPEKDFWNALKAHSKDVIEPTDDQTIDWPAILLFKKDIKHKMVDFEPQGFSIENYDVTEGLWADIMGTEQPHPSRKNFPKVNVSWYEACEFCNKRSEKENLHPVYDLSNKEDPKMRLFANGYRLPTEAEWWIAASDEGKYPDTYNEEGEDLDAILVAEKDRICAVGTRRPTSKGLYDIIGLVWQWMSF